MTWKKVMLHLRRKKKMILHLHLVKMKLKMKMKMIHLHLVKIVDEKERVAKVENLISLENQENLVSLENLASLENLENPVNPSLLQKDLKTLHFQIIRFLFKLNYFCERYLKTIKE